MHGIRIELLDSFGGTVSDWLPVDLLSRLGKVIEAWPRGHLHLIEIQRHTADCRAIVAWNSDIGICVRSSVGIFLDFER